MKIATMATGGIGGYLAAYLAQSGHEVATIARGAHLAAIRKAGLRLVSDGAAFTVRPSIATDDPQEVGPVDVLIFAVKGDSLPAAAEAAKPLVGPSTLVIPFLNGVEAAERLAAILPPQNVANGVAYISTTIREPGVIAQAGAFSRFIFAERDNTQSDRVTAFREALHEAGVSAPATDDIERQIWAKFVFFAALSGVTAAGRCTVGDVLDDAPLTGLFQTVIAETARLARARGVRVPDSIEADSWATVQGLPRTIRASTAIDLEKGSALEIDWVTGAVVRLSEGAGLDAPANRTLYALLSPYRAGAKPAGNTAGKPAAKAGRAGRSQK
jgi:2-dehydropantoate 2-reductase